MNKGTNKGFDHNYDYSDFIKHSNRSVRDIKRIFQKRKRRKLDEVMRQEVREMEESNELSKL